MNLIGRLPGLPKFFRYSAVSVVSTVTSLSLLGFLVATGTATAGWANLIATAVGTVPSFELNRRWVWGKSGRRSLAAEIGPFCALSFSGLALSTLAVSAASRWAAASGLGSGARTVVAEAANVATFGALWVAQYVILDRVLFRPRACAGGPVQLGGGSDRSAVFELHPDLLGQGSTPAARDKAHLDLPGQGPGAAAPDPLGQGHGPAARDEAHPDLRAA